MKRVIVTLLCLVMMISMAACASSSTTTASTTTTVQTTTSGTTTGTTGETTAGEKPLVGISVPNNPTGWVGAVQWSAKQTADQLGLNYRLVASEDANTQANQIDELISLGCKYIVLFPQNDELAVAAQKIMDAGITLVNFDRTLGSVVPDYYVAGSNKQMGVLGGEYIEEKLGGKGKVVIMNIPNYGAIFQERIDGFKSVVGDNKDIEILGEFASENGSPEAVLPVMSDILTKFKQIDAIYSTDDEMSKGILQAIKEANRTDIKVITGGGGDKSYFAMMDEFTNIWVSSQTYPPYMMSECVKLVDGLINGKTYESKIIIPAECVDRTNYKDYMTRFGITEAAPY